MFYVYTLTGPTGKVYVGKTNDVVRRWQQHIAYARAGKESHLCRAMRLLGIENFRAEIILTTRLESDVFLCEQAIIAQENAIEDGYNLTAGGEGAGGYVATPEVRAAQSARRKGKKPSPETVAARAEGLRKSEKHREARRRGGVTFRGYKHTPEALEKMRKAQVGKTVSLEARGKLSAALKGRDFSPEHRARISAATLAHWAKNPRPKKAKSVL